MMRLVICHYRLLLFDCHVALRYRVFLEHAFAVSVGVDREGDDMVDSNREMYLMLLNDEVVVGMLFDQAFEYLYRAVLEIAHQGAPELALPLSVLYLN